MKGGGEGQGWAWGGASGVRMLSDAHITLTDWQLWKRATT